MCTYNDDENGDETFKGTQQVSVETGIQCLPYTSRTHRHIEAHSTEYH